MSDPAHYVTSDYYQPGLLNNVAAFGFILLGVLGVFVAVLIGSQIVLRRSRRLNPKLRKTLQVVSALGKPAKPIRWRRRRDRLGSRPKSEAHYRMQPAPTSSGLIPTAEKSNTGRHSEKAQEADAPSISRRLPQDFSYSSSEAWPFYDEDEISAVSEVLRSGKVNQWTGSKVFEFEQAYTEMLGGGRAIALANGSVALELALRALRIGPGDEVIVTPRSFVASASCVRLVGATPIFADVDRDSGNITADTISAAISPRTKAVIPVHLAGWPVDMPAIMALARQHGLVVIEDCAQAHGAEIDGRPVGSFGDAATFSFCQDKIISTGGEGGLVTFQDDDAFEWAWSFKDHGKERSRALEPVTSSGFRWLHDQIGTNWRMSEVSAAIGLKQLEKLSGWQARRTRNAEIWREALVNVESLRVPEAVSKFRHGYYKMYVYVDAGPDADERFRGKILQAARDVGLRVFSGSCSEIYREAAFADLEVASLPTALELGNSSLMLEVHPTLDPLKLRNRSNALADIMRRILP